VSRSRSIVGAVSLASLAGIVISGCGVGDGVGAASGTLYVLDCVPGEISRGTPDAPAPYNMVPTFFAGEPIEDVRVEGRENRILIRLETAGERVRRSKGVAALSPVKDILYFDVDAHATALCVRAAATGAASPDPRTCFITGEGMARMRVGPSQPVRVSFAPRAECYKNIYVVGMARGDDPEVNGTRQPVAPTGWESWVDFQDFGSARSRDPASDFKVEYGETLHAKQFDLEIDDDLRLSAIRRDEFPPPPQIGGHLEGYFDFDLERGQGAQTFP
jgi:hypothetical protein